MQTQDSYFLNPGHILSQIEIQAGAKVGDLGCGTGYMSFAASSTIGEKGKVYAVDIQKGVLEQVKKEAQVENIKNIEILWADLEVPGSIKLPNQSLDVIFLVNVLFFLNNKEAAFTEARRLLKGGGHILVVEWLIGDMSIGPPTDKRVSKGAVAQLASRSNLSQIKDIDAGKYHYGVLYKNI